MNSFIFYLNINTSVISVLSLFCLLTRDPMVEVYTTESECPLLYEKEKVFIPVVYFV